MITFFYKIMNINNDTKINVSAFEKTIQILKSSLIEAFIQTLMSTCGQTSMRLFLHIFILNFLQIFMHKIIQMLLKNML